MMMKKTIICSFICLIFLFSNGVISKEYSISLVGYLQSKMLGQPPQKFHHRNIKKDPKRYHMGMKRKITHIFQKDDNFIA